MELYRMPPIQIQRYSFALKRIYRIVSVSFPELNLGSEVIVLDCPLIKEIDTNSLHK